MANKYTHSKPANAFSQKRTNARYAIANIKVGGKRQLGDNFGLYAHPLGKLYTKATGVIGKNNRAVSVA